MSSLTKLARVVVPVFSLTLLAGYVAYSHVTPNVPPPDPLGVNTIDLTLQPEVVEFEGFSHYGSPAPSGGQTGSDLRIISSKVINQPIFSTRKTTIVQASGAEGVPLMYVRPMMAGSKSGPVHFFGLNAWRHVGFYSVEVTVDPFGEAATKSPPPTPFPDYASKFRSEYHESRSGLSGPAPADPFDPSSPPAEGDPFAAPAIKPPAP